MLNFFHTKYFTIVAIAVVGVLGVAVWRQEPSNQAIERRVDNLQNEIADLNERNSELVSLEEYFKSDAYLEKEAKLKLNVKRPDENVVFIKSENSVASASLPAGGQVRAAASLPFWQRWLDKIFK